LASGGSSRFREVLTVVQVVSICWLLLARQLSGPRGIGAGWPPLPRAMLTCPSAACYTARLRPHKPAVADDPLSAATSWLFGGDDSTYSYASEDEKVRLTVGRHSRRRLVKLDAEETAEFGEWAYAIMSEAYYGRWSDITTDGKVVAITAKGAALAERISADEYERHREEIERAEQLWDFAMTVAQEASLDSFREQQDQVEHADAVAAQWHDPCTWITALLPILHLLSFALAITSSHAAGSRGAIWRRLLDTPEAAIRLGSQAAALGLVAAFSAAAGGGEEPHCTLGGWDAHALDALLVGALLVLYLPSAVPHLHSARQTVSRTFAPRDGAQFASLSSFKTTNSRLGGLMTRVLGPRPRVRFVATAPREFGAMRDGAGVDFERLQLSIESIEHAGGGLKGGASGAFLFPSQDGQLVVKTLSSEEAAALRKLAPSFARHFHDQPASYINRFLGQFSMYLYGRTIHFVVLRSAFHLHGDVSPAVRYDLKGSWVNRTGKPGQSVLKDNDLRRDGLRRVRASLDDCEKIPIKLPAAQYAKLIARLEADTAFLRDLNLMDYSLLLGVFDSPPPAAAISGQPKGAEETVLQHGGGVMLLGVIDVLQAWTCEKVGERCLKTYVKGDKPQGISAAPAGEYQQRFMSFVAEVFAPDESPASARTRLLEAGKELLPGNLRSLLEIRPPTRGPER